MAREIRTAGVVGLGTMDVDVAALGETLLFGYLNHAVRMCEEGYASREDIDAAMTLGCGLPMGPLAFRAIVELNAQQLEADGAKFALSPGMQVIAEIKLGERTLLEYLLSPVQKVVHEGARER